MTDRRVVEIADLLAPDISRDFNDGRTAAAVAQVVERAPHGIGDFPRHDHMLGDLRHATHLARRAEVRIDAGNAPRVALWDDQKWHGLAVRLGDATIGVLATGAVLHAEGADLLAGGDAGDRVGHVDPDALLTHDDRADIGRSGVFQQVVDRVAAEDLDPLALHDFRNCLADLHRSRSLCFGVARHQRSGHVQSERYLRSG